MAEKKARTTEASVRNRMVVHFFKHLKYRDFGLLPDALTVTAAWIRDESPVNWLERQITAPYWS